MLTPTTRVKILNQMHTRPKQVHHIRRSIPSPLKPKPKKFMYGSSCVSRPMKTLWRLRNAPGILLRRCAGNPSPKAFKLKLVAKNSGWTSTASALRFKHTSVQQHGILKRLGRTLIIHIRSNEKQTNFSALLKFTIFLKGSWFLRGWQAENRL